MTKKSQKKESIVEAKNLGKIYQEGRLSTLALQNVSFSLLPGTFNVLLGPSGAGKTTLLNLLGGMDHASSGSLTVFGKEIVGLSESALYEYRRDKVGLVFQFYNLIPNLNALENVELVTELSPSGENPERALEMVGLLHRKKNYPRQLSGGEQQRVCIARAIAKNPALLLCDEPTGALDFQTGKEILSLLEELAHDENKTVIIATHNASIAKAADTVLELRDGRLVKITANEAPMDLEELYW